RHSLVPVKPAVHLELPAFCSSSENSCVSNGGNSRSTPRASIFSNERAATLSTPRPGCASTQTVRLYNRRTSVSPVAFAPFSLGDRIGLSLKGHSEGAEQIPTPALCGSRLTLDCV